MVSTAAAGPLSRIVNINEEIKAVVQAARRVDTLALNAIVLARQAGTAARGFGEISVQLREYSTSLRTSMQRLTLRTGGMVGAVAGLLKRARTGAILQRAAQGSCGPVLRPACVRAEEQVRLDDAALAQRQRELLLDLDEANRLAELGRVLARNARVEAAHGAEFARALALVSDEFGQVVDDIGRRLLGLRLHTRELRA